MKNVIIALDQNTSAEAVAALGYAIAKGMNASVTLVHVLYDAAYYAANYSPLNELKGIYTEVTVEMIDEIKKEAEKFLESARAALQDNTVKTVLLEGDIETSILEFATDQQADLIVMGSHRHHGLGNLFLPDVAVHILKHTKIPLLAVPTKE